MGEELAGRFAGVFAGDIVAAKKPAPDIYNVAASALHIDPADCVVVEDSRNGLLAARAAGMPCIITQNDLTKGEDFTEAAIVLSSLGDPDGEQLTVVQNRSQAIPKRVFTVDDLETDRVCRRFGSCITKRRPMTGGSLEVTERVVRTIAETAIANEKYFADLDGVVGDGDFGIPLANGSTNCWTNGTRSIDRTRAAC